MAGADIRCDRLHGPVQFPVSAAVPMLAPALRWDHSASWDVPKDAKTESNTGMEHRRFGGVEFDRGEEKRGLGNEWDGSQTVCGLFNGNVPKEKLHAFQGR